MEKLRRWAKWIAVGVAAVVAFLIEVFLGQKRAEKDGEQIGRLEESKERLDEAAKKGDDGGVLDEFRRQTKR